MEVSSVVEHYRQWGHIDRMIRLLFKLIFVVVVAVALAGGSAFLYLDRLAQTAVEKGGSYALGVETTVERVSIGLGFPQASFGIDGLTVANPDGFSEANFLELGAASLELDLLSLMHDTVRAKSFVLDGVRVVLERNRKGSNYSVVMKSLESFESTAPDSSEADAASSKRLVIDELRITGVSAEMTLASIVGKPSKVKVAVPDIVLHDVGSDGSGVDVAELASIVTTAIFQAIVQAGGPRKILDDLSSGLANLGDVGSLTEGLSKNLSEGLGDVGGLVDSLGAAKGLRPDDEIGRVIDSILGSGRKSKP